MKKSVILYLIIILIFATFGMFGKLGIADLQPLGSAAHAAISREILRTGDWLTLHWPYCEEFEDFYQFPPLFFWLQAICFKIFGISDTTAKFVSAFFGVLVIILTFYLGKAITNDCYIGFLSSLTLILHPYFFRHARKCELETGLIFFVTLGILFFIIAEKNKKEWFLLFSGVATGLGFLYKGPPAYCVLSIIFIYYIITKQYKKITSIQYILAVLISLLTPMLWIIPQLLYKGNAVIEKFFINQILWSLQGRSARYITLAEKLKKYLFFVPVFFSYYLPWSATGIFGILKVIKERIKLFYILLIWIAVVWIGFTAAGYKDDYYLLLFWPGWAVINGFIFNEWTKKFQKNLTKVFLTLSIIFALATLFTPIKFDKIRNPEFRSLADFVKSTVPQNKRIITYNLFYYDMAALAAWYWDRGVLASAYPNSKVPKDAKAWKTQSVNTEDELEKLLDLKETQFLLIKKNDYEKLTVSLKNKIYILKEEGRFYFCSNIPNL